MKVRWLELAAATRPRATARQPALRANQQVNRQQASPLQRTTSTNLGRSVATRPRATPGESIPMPAVLVASQRQASPLQRTGPPVAHSPDNRACPAARLGHTTGRPAAPWQVLRQTPEDRRARWASQATQRKLRREGLRRCNSPYRSRVSPNLAAAIGRSNEPCAGRCRSVGRSR